MRFEPRASAGDHSEWGYLGKPLVGDDAKVKQFTVRVSRATFVAFNRYATERGTAPTDLLRDFIDGLLTRPM